VFAFSPVVLFFFARQCDQVVVLAKRQIQSGNVFVVFLPFKELFNKL